MEVVRTYYYGGHLYEEYCIINNKREGLYKKYYSNGQLWVIRNYIDGKLNGEYKTYVYGQLSSICNYIDGKENGEY